MVACQVGPPDVHYGGLVGYSEPSSYEFMTFTEVCVQCERNFQSCSLPSPDRRTQSCSPVDAPWGGVSDRKFPDLVSPQYPYLEVNPHTT